MSMFQSGATTRPPRARGFAGQLWSYNSFSNARSNVAQQEKVFIIWALVIYLSGSLEDLEVPDVAIFRGNVDIYTLRFSTFEDAPLIYTATFSSPRTPVSIHVEPQLSSTRSSSRSERLPWRCADVSKATEHAAFRHVLAIIPDGFRQNTDRNQRHTSLLTSGRNQLQKAMSIYLDVCKCRGMVCVLYEYI